MATSIPTTTSISNWNRATRHVEETVRSGRYVNAETTLLAAGPPRMSDIGGINSSIGSLISGNTLNPQGANAGKDALFPIGLAESFSLNQAHNVQKIFEIGSRRSYQAPGRVQVAGSFGRVVYNGPTLLACCYAYYPNTIKLANQKTLLPGTSSVGQAVLPGTPEAKSIYPPIFFEPGSYSGRDPESAYPHTFFMNLMSELFSHPFGLAVIFRDNANKNVGALYLEDCFITSHGLNVSATSSLVTEALQFQCDAAVPMEFSTDNGPVVNNV